MTLKRTGYMSKAEAYALLAMVLAAAEVTFVVRVMAWGRSGLLSLGLSVLMYSAGCLGVLVAVVVIVMPVMLLRRDRQLRAATGEGAHGAPLASTQPDLALALHDGEVVALRRRRTRLSTFYEVSQPLRFLILMPAAFGQPIALYIIVRGNLADIGFVAGLVVAGAIVVACGLWFLAALRTRWLRIFADDWGVTVERPLSRRGFIPRNDIRLFLAEVDFPAGAPRGEYVLWGREHLVRFEIGGPSTAVEGKERASSPLAVYRYVGGYVDYAANAARLLATITARSYVPLSVLPSTSVAARTPKETMLAVGPSLAAALAALPAPPELCPTPARIEAASQITGKPRLAPRTATPGFFLRMLAWFMAFGLLFIPGGILLHAPYFALDELLAGNPFALTMYGLLLPMLLVFAWYFAWTWHRRKHPSVAAEDDWLVVWSGYGTRIRWRDIRAWAVVPGTASSPTKYRVWSSDQQLHWFEPAAEELGGREIAGDRRAAFQARAIELHALIAARTGLPLRVLPANGEP